MNKSLLITITGFLVSVVMFASLTSAQPADPQGQNEQMKARVLEKYDYNHNGVLDPEELKALKEDNDAIIRQAKERVRERLERYDVNGNGKLDPEEREMLLRDSQREGMLK